MNDNNKEYFNPTWNQIEKSLRKLDGINFSYVQLSQSKGDEEFLLIGGGKDGKYLCIFYDGSESCVINPLETCNEKVKVTIGKVSERNKNELIGFDEILTISKTYFKSGERDGTAASREY